jgi:hypothetical protein
LYDEDPKQNNERSLLEIILSSDVFGVSSTDLMVARFFNVYHGSDTVPLEK